VSWQPPAPQYGVAPTTTLRPLAVGDILDVTFRLYRQNFVPMIKIAAIGVLPSQLLSLLILVSAMPDDDVLTTQTDAFGNETFTADAGDIWRFLAGIVAVALLGFVSNLIVTAAMTKAVAHSYVDGAPPDIRASFQVALRRLLPLIGMSILFVLGVAAGVIACFVGSVFLWVSWSVASVALIMEEAGPATSLRRSFTLVKARWWPTFGLLILVWLMTTIATQIISTPISMIAGTGGFFATSSDAGLGAVFLGSTVAGIIAGLLTTPFTAIITVVLYVDLRVRNEGFDIQVLARSLGVDAPPAVQMTPPTPPVAPPMAPPTAPEPPRWGSPPTP
jgi:hypothetical protein